MVSGRTSVRYRFGSPLFKRCGLWILSCVFVVVVVVVVIVVVVVVLFCFVCSFTWNKEVPGLT